MTDIFRMLRLIRNRLNYGHYEVFPKTFGRQNRKKREINLEVQTRYNVRSDKSVKIERTLAVIR